MEDVNFYVIRTLFNLLKSCYYDDALKEAGIQSLQYCRIFLSLVFLFRCLKNDAPEYVKLFVRYGNATSMICEALASKWNNKTCPHNGFSILSIT